MDDVVAAFDFVQTCRLETQDDVTAARMGLQRAVDPLNHLSAHPVEAWLLVEGGSVTAWFTRNGRQVYLACGEPNGPEGDA